MANGNHTHHVKAHKAGPTSHANPKPDDWDAIDQANADSFPASDPPGHGSFRAAANAATADAVGDQRATTAETFEGPGLSRLAKIAIGAGIGLAALGAVLLVVRLASRES